MGKLISTRAFLQAALLAGVATACVAPPVLAPAPGAPEAPNTALTGSEPGPDAEALGEAVQAAPEPEPVGAADDEDSETYTIQAAGKKSTPRPKPTPAARWPMEGTTSIVSLGIRAGRVFMGTDANPNTSCFDGNRVIDDQGAYPWKIRGANFGRQRGTVELTEVGTGRAFDLSITKWTSSVIEFKPRRPYSAGSAWAGNPAVTTAELEITFPQNGQVMTRTETVVPAIRQRIAGQCTWWAAKRRVDKGFGNIGAYSQHLRIDPTYVPRDGDQLMWKLSKGYHAAIIDGKPASSSEPIKGGQRVVWTIPITQHNTDLKCGASSYTATWTVETRAKRKPVAKGLTFGANSRDAWGYYR